MCWEILQHQKKIESQTVTCCKGCYQLWPSSSQPLQDPPSEEVQACHTLHMCHVNLGVQAAQLIVSELRNIQKTFLIRWNTFNTVACKHVLSWDFSRSRLSCGSALNEVLLLNEDGGCWGGWWVEKELKAWSNPPAHRTETFQVRRLAFIIIRLRDTSLQFIRWNTLNTAARKPFLSWACLVAFSPFHLRENHIQASTGSWRHPKHASRKDHPLCPLKRDQQRCSWTGRIED